ncbi:MAG: YjeF-related protein [Chitinophagaceae bacterium]|nr:YjeF-related protein [Chitinophagaceae bacterium]
MDNIPGHSIDAFLVHKILKPRDPFTHKGNYGHACLLAGSYGMMGAAVLAAKACARSGVGKLTCFIPKIGYDIMQASIPEAMVKVCGKKTIKEIDEVSKFDVLGIGPGIGIYKSHSRLLQNIFSEYRKPMVVDADALNILSENKKLLNSIPAESILTPHPKEFERLFGKTKTNAERTELALKMAHQYKIYIVLKSHHTLIAAPDKQAYFNSTGNAGMATGGSGDVLTGILTGLLAQGYSSLETCLLGVYLHGLAGDIAAGKLSQHALIAGDIIDNLGNAFKQVNKE